MPNAEDQTDIDYHLSAVAHSEDGARQAGTSERGVEALRGDSQSFGDD